MAPRGKLRVAILLRLDGRRAAAVDLARVLATAVDAGAYRPVDDVVSVHLALAVEHGVHGDLPQLTGGYSHLPKSHPSR